MAFDPDQFLQEKGFDPDSFLEQRVPRETQTAGDVAKGTGQALLEGATLGFDDEIQSIIAAAVAAPFISDKTFSQLMVDARKSFREDKQKFAEQNPKTALAANVAGGLATGGAGASVVNTVKGGALVGGLYGTGAGAGFSDQEEFFSKETAKDAAITGAASTTLGAITPVAIKIAARAGKLIPKEMPRKLLETALKFRPSISSKDRARMTDTALKEGILPTVSGLEKIIKKLEGLDSGLNKIIDRATERGVLISKKTLFTELKKLRAKIGGPKLDAGQDLKNIDSVVKSFDEQLKAIGKQKLTPREVQTLKQDAYKRINFDLSQGKANYAKNETRKSIAKAAKESLEQIDENIKPINQRMGDLIQLQNEMERVVSRLDNRNLISLDTAVKIGSGAATGTGTGTAVGTGASVLGAPRVKARAAMMLENLRVASEAEKSTKGLAPELSGALAPLITRVQDAIRDDLNELEDD